MCTDHEVPIVELHDMTGEPVGLRRDTIALVKSLTPEQNPLGGSLILTDHAAVSVVESPGEVLRAIRAEVTAVVDLTADQPAGSA